MLIITALDIICNGHHFNIVLIKFLIIIIIITLTFSNNKISEFNFINTTK